MYIFEAELTRNGLIGAGAGIGIGVGIGVGIGPLIQGVAINA